MIYFRMNNNGGMAFWLATASTEKIIRAIIFSIKVFDW